MNSTINEMLCKAPNFDMGKNIDMTIPGIGGKLNVKWAPGIKVTSAGGLAYFAEFLKATEYFEKLCEDFPLQSKSNNSCSKRDIIGTAVFAILCGCSRYAHVNFLRNDTAAKELLGLDRIVSEDTIRRVFRKTDETKLDEWLLRHEHEVADAILHYKYVLDIDNSIKPIFGHQEGSELGYNPHKPGRPSHNYHSFFIGKTRITLGVDVKPGKQHSGQHGTSSMWKFLDSLPRDKWPEMIRGDVGYGTDRIMTEAESRDVKYLFKIKRAGLAKKTFTSFIRDDEWKDCGEGWQSHEERLTLTGWKNSRRCIYIRRPSRSGEKKGETESPNAPRKQEHENNAEEKKVATSKQLEFEFVKDIKKRDWDYCILVTNDNMHDATALSQLYRDRGDCENNFDEYKNQWGWGGFTTNSIKSCKAMARLIAIVANWWNVFCRLACPDSHREAITSRPAFLNIMGRVSTTGGKKVIHLTSPHADAELIMKALTHIGAFLNWVDSNAEQLNLNERRILIWTYAFRKLRLENEPSSQKPTATPA